MPYFFYAEFAIEINQVYRKLHKKRMDRLARHDPESLSTTESFAAQQAFRALRSAMGEFCFIRNARIPRQIMDNDAAVSG